MFDIVFLKKIPSFVIVMISSIIAARNKGVALLIKRFVVMLIKM